jgi:hypothetical protein
VSKRVITFLCSRVSVLVLVFACVLPPLFSTTLRMIKYGNNFLLALKFQDGFSESFDRIPTLFLLKFNAFLACYGAWVIYLNFFFLGGVKSN